MRLQQNSVPREVAEEMQTPSDGCARECNRAQRCESRPTGGTCTRMQKGGGAWVSQWDEWMSDGESE